MIKDPNNFGILTTQEEKQTRNELCLKCEKHTIVMDVPTCDACACPIEYVTTYKFKICPLEKWSIE